MDYLGNDTTGDSLSSGGTINGDLDIEGNLEVENLNVLDTATINTLITVEELEVKDTLITCGVDNNTGDNFNLGLLDEHKDGSQVWGGLIRSKDDTNYYLLRDQTPKPTPTSNITTTNRAELGTVHVNQLNASVIDSDGFVRANSGLVLNQNTDSWLIKPDIGLNGQVLTFNSGDDTATWAAGGGGGSQTLQQTYDLSSSPMISSTAANPTLVLKQTSVGSDELLELQNITGVKRMGLSADGELEISGSNSAVKLKTSAGAESWTLQNDGGGGSFRLISNGIGDAITCTQGGEVSFNDGLSQYSFPVSRGLNGQILTSKFDGSTTAWETPASSSSTLQEAFDLSTNPQIETDVTNTELTLKSHSTSAEVFSIVDSNDLECITVNAAGDMSIRQGGNINIGAGGQEGNAQLTVCSPSETRAIFIEYSNSASPASVDCFKARGTMASPTNVVSGTFLASLKGYGYETDGFKQGVNFNMKCSQNWTSGAHGSEMVINTVENGSTSPVERFIFGHDGKLGLGVPASRYELPNARGSTGEVLRNINNSGSMTFQQLTPSITTANSIPKFGTTGLMTASGWTIDASDNLTDNISSFTGASGLSTTECHADSVHLKDGIGVDKWSISRQGADTFNIRNALDVDTLVLGQDGTCQFKIAGSTEAVINGTGLHMQGNPIDEVSTIEVSTDIQYAVPFFHGYFYGNHPITLVTQNVWQQAFLGGGFISGADTTNFSFNTNGVATYTGSRDRRCEVTCTFSIGIDPTQVLSQFEIFVSVGIPPDLTLDNANGSQCLMFMGANDNEAHTGSSHFYPKLTNGDTLRMYIRCTTSANALIQMRAESFIGTCVSNVV